MLPPNLQIKRELLYTSKCSSPGEPRRQSRRRDPARIGPTGEPKPLGTPSDRDCPTSVPAGAGNRRVYVATGITRSVVSCPHAKQLGDTLEHLDLGQMATEGGPFPTPPQSSSGMVLEPSVL